MLDIMPTSPPTFANEVKIHSDVTQHLATYMIKEKQMILF